MFASSVSILFHSLLVAVAQVTPRVVHAYSQDGELAHDIFLGDPGSGAFIIIQTAFLAGVVLTPGSAVLLARWALRGPNRMAARDAETPRA